MSKPKLVLIVGSGFSKEAGIPTTAELASQFLNRSDNGVVTETLENSISSILKRFWNDVFGYVDGDRRPSMEDHFTMIDLAANSGHHLSPYWSPKRLRAIRRMSIHRVFQILDKSIIPSPSITRILTESRNLFDVSIVSLNWDIVVEKRLQEITNNYELYPDYGINFYKFNGDFVTDKDISLLKLHGSSNWVYCDNCRRIFAGSIKEALHRMVFLEKDDFELFDDIDIPTFELLTQNDERKCPNCGNIMGGRVATFSYRKAFSISQFQEIWSRTLDALGMAENWLFVGYSMPQADFEFRHIIKSAQFARKTPPNIQAIIKKSDDWDGGRNNFKEFFGRALDNIYDNGLSHWVDNQLEDYCNRHGETS